MIDVTFNGVGYPVPETDDTDWGSLTDYLVAIASGALQKTGGTFTLTADVNFGASKGVVSSYLKSRSSNIAAAGFARLAVGDLIAWRNTANNADLALSVNGTDQLSFNSQLLLTSTGSITANRALASNGSGSIISSSVTDTELGRLSGVGSAVKGISDAATLTNKSIDAATNTLTNINNAAVSSSAAIAYSKLNLATSILNADVNASAAIARSKLAGLVVTSQTTTYPIAASDDVVLCSGSAFTATLPTAVGVSGKQYRVKKTDASLTNIITIGTTSSQTIDGSTTFTLNTQNESVDLVSDGSNWQVIDRSIPNFAVAYTPTFTGFGSPTTVRVTSQRVGDSLYVQGFFTAGSVTAVTAAISLGFGGVNGGLTIDSTKLTSTSAALVGVAGQGTAGGSLFGIGCLATGGGTVLNFGSQTSVTSILTATTANLVDGTGAFFSFTALVPISGWH